MLKGWILRCIELRGGAILLNKISDLIDICGAADRTRTYDPIITNDVLYQLSYSGAEAVYRRSVCEGQAK